MRCRKYIKLLYGADFTKSIIYAETTVVGSGNVLYYYQPSIVIKPDDDLDSNGYKDVVYEVYKGIYQNSNYPYQPWIAGFLRIAEHALTGVDEWTVLPSKGSKPVFNNLSLNPIKDLATISLTLPLKEIM